MTNNFVCAERSRATAWKASLPEPARVPSPYVRNGEDDGPPLAFCLPRAHAELNLLDDVRDSALGYFAANEIVWHQCVGDGPTNHLLSSQVQCVNALERMATDPQRLVAALGEQLGIDEPVEIEPGRYVAFEYIGAGDPLGEVPWGTRRRGSMTTSVDAAIRFRSTRGEDVLALIEWKYTEDYRGKELHPEKRRKRTDIYRSFWESPTCPVRHDVIRYEDLFVEPFYQLLRQQLFAQELSSAFDRVCVVHVSPSGNLALRGSLNRPSHLAVGDDVFDIWRSMVVDSTSFVSVDSSVFCDAALTSDDYVARYG